MARAGKGSEPLRILFVTRNLPPLRGGMERLCRHMAIELGREFEVTVVGPRDAREFLPREIDLIGVAAAPLWKFFLGALLRSLRAAWRIRPHIVLGGSGLVAPFVWLAARLSGAHAALYVHGLDLIVPHPVYRMFWCPMIRRADLCIANSHHTARLAAAIGVPPDRTAIVHPGVDMPDAEAMARPNDFRARFGLGDRPLLLSVGRLIARKGLLEFVENALPKVVSEFPDICLVIIGDEAPQLLHGSSVGLGDRVRQRAAELCVTDNIRFIGPQDDATLMDAWRAADVHVFPVREVSGDVEGFGMVAVEAAAHGLPTVAFAVGGVPDAIADSVSGYLVPPGDYEQFVLRLHELLSVSASVPRCKNAVLVAENLAWPKFGERLRACIRLAVHATR
jgi:phosphatidylinositol alpha-1,6-mannosyltransferase